MAWYLLIFNKHCNIYRLKTVHRRKGNSFKTHLECFQNISNILSIFKMLFRYLLKKFWTVFLFYLFQEPWTRLVIDKTCDHKQNAVLNPIKLWKMFISTNKINISCITLCLFQGYYMEIISGDLDMETKLKLSQRIVLY